MQQFTHFPGVFGHDNGLRHQQEVGSIMRVRMEINRAGLHPCRISDRSPKGA
jgi:hypothetical protein